MPKRSRTPTNALNGKVVAANLAINGATTTQWRRIFDRQVERGQVYNPKSSFSPIPLAKPNMDIAGLAGVTDAAVSRWGISLRPGKIPAQMTRWGRFDRAQDFLEHLFYDGRGRLTPERQAFRQAYVDLPPFDLSKSSLAALIAELLTTWQFGQLSMLSLPPTPVKDEAFTLDVLTLVRAGYYRDHPAIPPALAALAAMYEAQGLRSVADAIADTLASSLLRNNDIGVSADIIADLLHVCESDEQMDALVFVQSAGVSEARKWQEFACAACKLLRHGKLDAAEELLEKLESSLAHCNSDTKGMLELHRGRISLMKARRVDRNWLCEAAGRFQTAERWFEAVSPTHTFLPHVRVYQRLAELLLKPSEGAEARLTVACEAVSSGVGDRCLDPCQLAAALVT